MTETKSRINIDGPCPRCGKETFKGDCSDPWCHAAYMEADNERLERELQEAREAIRMADPFMYGRFDWNSIPAVLAAKGEK